MHLSTVSPIPCGDLSKPIPQIWGIAYPLQYPMFSPPTTLGDSKPLCFPDNVKNSIVRLFADDCILYRTIHTPNDCSKLQDDLHSLEQWKKTWLMKFNPNKCYVMTISLAT